MIKKGLGQQVRNLCLGMKEHNPQLISILSTVFPHLRLLQSKGGDTDTVYLPTAQNWNSIEEIKDSSNGHLTTQLLQLLAFDHLSCMEVT